MNGKGTHGDSGEEGIMARLLWIRLRREMAKMNSEVILN